MAFGLLSTISAFVTDVVAIYDQNFNQVFKNARPIKAVVKPDSKLMEHPIETGATITDHRITLPVEIELSLILTASTYKESYQQIQQLFNDATLLSVQTKANIYYNQLIQSLPHEEAPETFDIITLALKLKEVQFSSAQFQQFSPKDPNKASTVDKGTQQSSDATPQQRVSVAEQIGDGAKALAKKIF